MRLPARTTSRSSGRTCSAGMRTSLPFSSRRASCGTSDTNAATAAVVLPLARASNHLPRVTSVKIMAEDSKYNDCKDCPLCKICTNVHAPEINAAPEPKATKLSILGAPATSSFPPRVKKARLSHSTGSASINCTPAKTAGFCTTWAGTMPHMGPIETYKSGSKKATLSQNRFLREISSRAPARLAGAATPYPAAAMAWCKACALKSSVTVTANLF